MEKKISETVSTIVAIVVYVVGMSVFDSISVKIGQEKLLTMIFTLLYSLFLYIQAKKDGKLQYLGLKRPEGNAKEMLHYLPLVAIGTVNLWLGAEVGKVTITTLFFVISMIMTGFLEEVIFRGMLFRMMEKDNRKSAIFVASILFGVGHLVNLINGSGREVFATLMQVVYATAIGLVFVLIFLKTGSILPQIICHSTINALSAFGKERGAWERYVVPIALVVISLSYAAYLQKKKKDIW